MALYIYITTFLSKSLWEPCLHKNMYLHKYFRMTCISVRVRHCWGSPKVFYRIYIEKAVIIIGNLVQLPAPLEVRNPGLSANGSEQKTCQRSGLYHDGSSESVRFHTGIRHSSKLLFSPKRGKHAQKQGFRKFAQKYTSRQVSEWLLENDFTWFVMDLVLQFWHSVGL